MLKKLQIVSFLFFHLLFCDSYTYAQSIFEGTWQYQNGNEVFIVKIWEEDNVMLGYYKKITTDASGNQTSLIFTSRKDYGNGDYYLDHSIYGDVSETELNALFDDNTMANSEYNIKRGYLNMKILQQGLPGCTTCTTTATWKITEKRGLRVNYVEGFSVPTDIVLTKVSNEVVFD